MRQVYVLLGLCLAFAATSARAEEPSAEPSAPSTTERARAHMGLFAVRVAGSDDPVPLIETPLLGFGDTARRNRNGTVWAFGDQGRPLAILELYQREEADNAWMHALTLTSHQSIVMKTPLGVEWTPAKPQIEWQAFASAPRPGAKPAQRTRQLKELARRFSAHEFWDPDNSRFELRLLVQPIHRYDDEEKSLHDGAVFVLAHGTNPEVLLLIEAVGDSVEAASWRFGLVRLGSAEMHASCDGKEVWTVARKNGSGPLTDPYWLFLSAP